MTMDTEMQRILAVDDNPHTLRIVEHSLSRAGFDVLTATSGEDALSVISRRGLPHLAVVDLNMPGMDGVELSRTIHDFSDLPIIMLTAVHEEETIVSSIEEFAEDYMVKPFSPSELVARVRRVLRRMGNFGYTLEPVTVVDNRLQVDFANRVAIVDGESTNLTPIETKLLYVLMCNAGKVVTTEFLIRRIWPMDEAYEDRLHVHVHRLRRKVEQEPSKPQYVVSERGVGYRFPARQPV
jgi:DNA-binding response OmpR family regulator